MNDVRFVRVWALTLSAALSVGCAGTVFADIDMTGRWTDYVPEFGIMQCNDYVQSGTTLTATACDMSGSSTGTIDPMTGQFSFVGPPSDVCPPQPASTLNGVVAPDGQSYTGTLCLATTPQSCAFGFCTDAYGVRACGDHSVDPDNGEQCDDGNIIDGDCCSAACQFEAEGAPCVSDGDACTGDRCSATGVCLHTITPAPGCKNDCAAGKIKATCKKAYCKARLEAKEAATGYPIDSEKVAKCETKFSSAFLKLELRPPCATTGDADDIETKVDAFVADLATELDVATGTNPNRCEGVKIRFAAKKAVCKCLLESKQAATPGDPPIPPGQTMKCEDDFSERFAKAELKGGCNTTGDTDAIEAKVDAFVADIDTALYPP